MTPPSPSPDSGNMTWSGLNVKLSDGKARENVYSIWVTDSRYRLSNGLGVGTSFATVKKAFPRGTAGGPDDIREVENTWTLPGLTIEINDGVVSGFSLTSVDG